MEALRPGLLFRYHAVDDDPERLEEWLALRKVLYLAEDLITEDDLDDRGRYVDEYEPFSEHILMFDQVDPEIPIGTCRIIDCRRTRLQVADQFGVEHSDNALEVSGFAVLPSYRKTFATLGCYRYVLERAWGGFGNDPYDEIHFEVEVPFKHTLADIGLPLTQTAEERFVYGAVNVPLRVLPNEMIDSLRAADARRGNNTHFAELFERPFDGFLNTESLFGNATGTEEASA